MRDDRRHIDLERGVLEGEGSQQRVRDVEHPAPQEVWTSEPTAEPGDPTYYERPVLKEPVWISAVPTYFWVGGAAGAAAVLGAAAQVVDRDGLAGLVRRARWMSTVGAGVGGTLLVVDLGKPSRFLNMLRVFRPSSPMSVGSWVLAGFTPLAGAAAVTNRSGGVMGLAGDGAGLAAGALGMPLAGYTAVLLSNTAVPVWQGTLRSLPALFMSSGVTAAASLLCMLELTEREERAVRRFGIAGKVADLVASKGVEHEADRVESVGRPLHEGLSGTLWKASEALTAASLALSLLPGRRSRARRVVEGTLGAAGSLAMRFAVFHAGKASSRDPRATFHQQRAGLGAPEPAGV
ncbi:MAG TPA: NrfD/PsrC family molybdoenzyme membrane anchor subunit [Actinomycetota bacterium]|nr:NrfD/PsrC family molybdoenzyme membrane anchor subunit [Actinomycetota bacterium]